MFKTREPTITSALFHLTSSCAPWVLRRAELGVHPYGSALQLPSLVAATTLVLATLGDVLFARCSGSSLRVNLLPTYLVGELAAEGLARRPEGESQLGGYGATQSALAVGSVQHLGGCHV